MERISTSPRYVTDITELDPLLLGELGGGFEKNRKNEVLVTYERVDQILKKFHILKDLVLQSSCPKSRPDPVTLGGGEGETGNLGKRMEWIYM